MTINPGRILSVKWLCWQSGGVGCIAITYLILAGTQSGYSALLGGLISILANGYFAWKLFTHTGARAANRIVANLYAAEALKLLIAGAGLATIFMWAPVEPTAVLVGFLGAYLGSIILIALLTK